MFAPPSTFQDHDRRFPRERSPIAPADTFKFYDASTQSSARTPSGSLRGFHRRQRPALRNRFEHAIRRPRGSFATRRTNPVSAIILPESSGKPARPRRSLPGCAPPASRPATVGRPPENWTARTACHSRTSSSFSYSATMSVNRSPCGAAISSRASSNVIGV